MNLLLAAEEAAGVQMLRALAKGDHRIVAVMTESGPSGESGASVWGVARALGYPTWPGRRVVDADLADTLREHAVDMVLNVHSLNIFHAQVLSAARIGCYNLHPGPLPRYAGLNSVSWAIYRREPYHGVTIHRMEAGIDTGAIAYQELFPIGTTDTALTVSARCVRLGVQLLLRLVDTAARDPASVPALEQDLSQREYFGRDVPRHGRLSWAEPAEAVVAFVRAADYYPLRSPWGHPKARMADREIGIVSARTTGNPAGVPPGTVSLGERPSVCVASADEWISISRVHVDGRYVPAAAVLAPGIQLQDG